ncbi:MAG: response regulator [Candidatus Liberibacter ctenarytainae]|uniref:Response regulator n=1 Tax=Candidatus Liberibacter ctenarytainae TaxID=2020335 RepID=A0A937DMB7_9HYPH|nr:response regulator [Candidatus Liberibacter ctenarytainae]
MQRLLLVDPSHIIRKVGRNLFGGFGFEVFDACNLFEAKEFCKKEPLPDYIIVDESIDDVLEFISSIRRMPLGMDVFIYYLLVEVDFEKMISGAKSGANSFLLKPFNRKTLQFAMRDLPQMKKIEDTEATSYNMNQA